MISFFLLSEHGARDRADGGWHGRKVGMMGCKGEFDLVFNSRSLAKCYWREFLLYLTGN